MAVQTNTDHTSTMSAEWLKNIVDVIKKEDHAVAEREYQTVRRAELIALNGPVFWRTFTDSLEALFRQMEELFGNHVTKGKIAFTRSPYGGGVSINKSAYPFVSFSATPNFSETTAHFTYTVVNPEIPNNMGVPGRFMPCRFGVDGENIVISLEGHLFTTPEGAAKFIIEKLFTIASSELTTVTEMAEAAAVGEALPAPEPFWPRAPRNAASEPPLFETLADSSYPGILGGAAAKGDLAPAVSAETVLETPVAETPALPSLPELPASRRPRELLTRAAVAASSGPPPLPESALRSAQDAKAAGRTPLKRLWPSLPKFLISKSAPPPALTKFLTEEPPRGPSSPQSLLGLSMSAPAREKATPLPVAEAPVAKPVVVLEPVVEKPAAVPVVEPAVVEAAVVEAKVLEGAVETSEVAAVAALEAPVTTETDAPPVPRVLVPRVVRTRRPRPRVRFQAPRVRVRLQKSSEPRRAK